MTRQHPGKWGRRDLLILAFLLLFTVQCVRSDFFVNESSGINWRSYASGTYSMPYQGRVGMMPVLRWAGHNSLMVRGAAKYQSMLSVGSKFEEPVTVEKFVSLLVGLFAALLLVGYASLYGKRQGFEPWWLPSVLLLVILTITLSVRSEHNVWTPYDLPHALLFGIAVMCAFQSEWLWMLLLFALDVPVRETSIFLIAVSVPMSYIAWRNRPKRNLLVAVMGLSMAAYWLAWRVAIQRSFVNNPNDTGVRFSNNLHELLFFHHWPQIFCAGGYLIVFIWLERHLLSAKERLLLYCTLAMTPVTLYFGVWGETRIWLEWSLPWAVLAAAEVQRSLRPVPVAVAEAA